MSGKTRCRIAITGIGLVSPNGNSPSEYRNSLLNAVSGIRNIDLRYIGRVHAGVCAFDTLRHQNKRDVRNGTRAGSIAIYCAGEALNDAGIAQDSLVKDRTGVYIGLTEHGNVETENEVYNISRFNYDIKFWNHYHNPRTVLNSPAGEVTIKFGVTGPHYCIGAACAGGNAGLIQGAQQLELGEVDLAIAGGVSESIGTFGIFASFKSQNALAIHDDPTKASRPFDFERNGIVVAEGGCLFIMERLEDAVKRGAKIYCEILGYAMNSDAAHPVLPNAPTQAQCIEKALRKAGLRPQDIDLVSTHGTGTKMGDAQEVQAIKQVFAQCDDSQAPFLNNTKGFIGHAMGAAGALELAGNIPTFSDNLIHPCMNLDNLDQDCEIRKFVTGSPLNAPSIKTIANNSFGMMGINSVVIVGRHEPHLPPNETRTTVIT
ncbi:MAG: beta-ketoacyl-[acyl-carrier-protein] synthase family protein [Victivallales bacterium]|nr:beta-ketoacyl-[acyl-carrier-protein] synthase family protein [Victivallales bacterium]